MYYTEYYWLMVFFTYSFFGWIWEVIYASFHEKKFTNRGFLYGPLLPIYGFGAIIILAVSSPFETQIPKIFIAGMIAPTILEYFTGYFMEKSFKIKYWDYTDKKFNLNGYICLSGSLLWGVFSVILVKEIHPIIEHFLLYMPIDIIAPASTFLFIIFVADTTISIDSALDFRDLLEKLNQANDTFKTAQAKFKNIAAEFSENPADTIKQYLYMNRQLKDDIAAFVPNKSSLAHKRKILLEKISFTGETFISYLAQFLSKYEDMISYLQNKLTQAKNDSEKKILTNNIKEAIEIKNKVLTIKKNYMDNQKNNRILNALNIIKRNPTSKSFIYKQSFNNLKELIRSGKN